TLEGAAVVNDIRARGTYRADEQLVVVDRALGARPGSWVLTPLTVQADGGTATLPVVRGWVPQGTPVPAPPSGQVEVVGRLQGSEVPAGPEPDLPRGQTRVVSAADLVNRWGPPIYAGYLVVASPVEAPLHPVPAKDPGDEGRGFHLLNLSYALQWWVFAGFAVFLWWRMVRDSHLAALGETRDGDDADAADADEDGDDEGGADPPRLAGENQAIQLERGVQR
ncbi:MAG: SURF1 family protein, partial [Actinomycetes bacterium]